MGSAWTRADRAACFFRRLSSSARRAPPDSGAHPGGQSGSAATARFSLASLAHAALRSRRYLGICPGLSVGGGRLECP